MWISTKKNTVANETIGALQKPRLTFVKPFPRYIKSHLHVLALESNTKELQTKIF